MKNLSGQQVSRLRFKSMDSKSRSGNHLIMTFSG